MSLFAESFNQLVSNAQGRSRFLILALPLFLCGFQRAPAFQAEGNGPMVTLRLSGLNLSEKLPLICIGGKRFRLTAQGEAPNQTVQVPAGSRISVGVRAVTNGTFNFSICESAISFVPAAGTTYVAADIFGLGVCAMEIVREDASRESGLSPEPSIGPSTCPLK